MALPDLIYDRTTADVALWEMLSTKLDTLGWSGLTEQEQLQWLSPLKGCYNHTDLNRVGTAVSYLGERFLDFLLHLIAYRSVYGVASAPLFEAPYTAEDVRISPKIDWLQTDHMTEEQAAQYVENLSVLRSLIPLPDQTPTVPPDLDCLTMERANDMEALLSILDATLTQLNETLETKIYNTSLAWMFSGEVFSQEV